MSYAKIIRNKLENVKINKNTMTLTRNKLFIGLVIIIFVYITGQAIASLLFTSPLLFIYIIMFCVIVMMIGLVRAPFRLIKAIKLIRKRRS